MILNRRTFGKVAAAALAVPAFGRQAFAQAAYPAKPVTVIVPYDPGPVELITRLVCDKLSEKLGQRFVVETKPGAASAIGTEYVTRAPADGYTLLSSSATSMITMQLTIGGKLNYDAQKDLRPIATIFTRPYVLYVNPSLGVKSIKELVDLAKQKPGALTYSTSGIGAHSHLVHELFNHLAGIEVLHIPYKGSSPALQAVLTNEVDMHFGGPSQYKQYAADGQLIALGVTSPQPISQLPQLPAIADTVPGVLASAGVDMFAPAATSDEIVDMLNAAVLEVCQIADLKERIATSGEVSTASPSEIKAAMETDYKTLSELIATLGLKLE